MVVKKGSGSRGPKMERVFRRRVIRTEDRDQRSPRVRFCTRQERIESSLVRIKVEIFCRVISF